MVEWEAGFSLQTEQNLVFHFPQDGQRSEEEEKIDVKRE